ncbi:MAG: aminotransferase class V-fold PLP-dependent enzyme [Eubacteriales bacterium]|nr:aminotransferase class V-fold PLP-dependent enzyme [Eubacteriales bacterium]
MRVSDELRSWAELGHRRWHMPGHKGRPAIAGSYLPWAYDTTELRRSDDLHHPTGVLAEMLERGHALFGGEGIYALTGGSTEGILMAIYATVERGADVLVARQSHRAVWHGLELVSAKIHTIPSRYHRQVPLPPSLAEIQEAYRPEIRYAILTSPTYEGLQACDLAASIEFLHERDVLVIVDAAHGAQFGHGPWPVSAIQAAADISVMSLHKTLPAPTSTAILVYQGERLDRDALARAFDLFATSSPSYWLLAGIDECFEFLVEADFEAYYQRCQQLRVALAEHGPLYEAPVEYCQDVSKFLLRCDDAQGLDESLYQLGFESEYARSGMVLLMEGPLSDEVDLSKLPTWEDATEGDRFEFGTSEDWPPFVIQIPRRCVYVPSQEAINEVAARELWLYPPGIPLVLPGERYRASVIEKLNGARDLRGDYLLEADDLYVPIVRQS